MSARSTEEVEKLLKRPFPVNVLKWRILHRKGDKAIVAAYLNARDVMKRLDEVCGIDGWQRRHPYAGCCEIGIRFGDEWVWKSDGAGETNIEGEKGQFSDSFKRAAAVWGVGRYLYYLPNTYVHVDGNGRFTPPELPRWAIPGE